MVKVDVVGRKLTRATDRLDKAERILSGPAGEFLADEDAQDLASFHLFLAIQECIDLALHWVVDEGWEAPDDAGSTFLVLADRKVIDRELAERMRDAVGLRNLMGTPSSITPGFSESTRQALPTFGDSSPRRLIRQGCREIFSPEIVARHRHQLLQRPELLPLHRNCPVPLLEDPFDD
jgi:uncharacterized protein YutE (UPF0331/DUF86 family)